MSINPAYQSAMDAPLTDYALSLPHAFMTEQWRGAYVFKVGTASDFKMFAVSRPGDDSLAVKCPSHDIFELLLAAEVGRRHTHLKRGNWIVLDLAKIDPDDARDRIRESYETVVSSLKAGTRAELGFD